MSGYKRRPLPVRSSQYYEQPPYWSRWGVNSFARLLRPLLLSLGTCTDASATVLCLGLGKDDASEGTEGEEDEGEDVGCRIGKGECGWTAMQAIVAYKSVSEGNFGAEVAC